jgi:hypothetical protein
MLLLVALAAGLFVAFLLWQTMIRRPPVPVVRPSARRRVTAPDDDPEFLRELGERLRGDGGDPPKRR